MAEGLRIVIGAETKDLEKALSRAKKDINRFEIQAGRGAKGMDKFGKSTRGAIPATQEFSRVIQDAPFGIQGVANNIQQLTANFGTLSKNAGGTKAALKAMLGTLTGPAGILLAVSAITSLLVAFGDKLSFSKTEAEKKKDAIDKLNDSLKEYSEQLTGVAKAQLKGSQNATDELTNLTLLKAQLDNTNLSQKERLSALNELQKKYPSYLGNVSSEDALVGGLDEQYNKLSEAILNNARAKASASLISENYKKILNLEAQAEEQSILATEKRIEADKRAAKALKQISDGNEKGLSTLQSGVNTLTSEAEDADKKLSEFTETIAKLNAENTKLAENVTVNGGIIKDFGNKTKKAKEEILSLADRLEIGDLQDNLDSLKELDLELAPTLKLGATLDNIDDETFRNQIKLWYDTNIKEPIDEGGKEVKDKLTLLNENISQIANQGIFNALSGIGDAIGNALASGANVASAIGQGIISAFGKFLSQMGDLLIQYGLFAKVKGKLDTAIAAGGPASIAAGAAAVAIGVALKAAGSAIGNRSQQGFDGASGGVSGATSSGGSSNFGSSISSGGGFGGRVIFEIAGDKLIGVLNNSLGANDRIGDNVAIG